MGEILEVAKKILEEHCLCDNCLGRQFASLGYGLSNAERGKTIKSFLAFEAHNQALNENKDGISLLENLAVNGMFKLAEDILKRLGYKPKTSQKKCELCEGKLQKLESFVGEMLKKVEGYEFNSFLVGAKIPEKIIEAEDSLRANYKVKWGETIKSEFTREIGKIISRVTKKHVDYKKPDIVFTINPFTEEIGFQVNPLFIGGRYKKLVAGIPQARWVCGRCGGVGCEHCGWTGKKYPESVQEIIEKPILELTLGEKTEFHASGREDIDAKVLGNGRPFIIEVKNPKKRNIDLKLIEEEINRSGKVEVLNLYFADKQAVRKIKSMETAKKVYRVIVEVEDGGITDEDLKKIEEKFTDVTVKQQTPTRVLHRRADKTRIKHVYRVKTKKLSQKSFELEVECQGGLYVKELVDGDQGRTKPNISEVIQKGLRCVELTVLEVQA
ncbi:MAG: tRNA pseudouridine(54/55) synthase Pus10 [Candidatus Hecatellales archaeon]|nr:MAG: tRNA pseudouridine(54/55) synthase Pus10 [Candidatus Hecatellales archaeon]